MNLDYRSIGLRVKMARLRKGNTQEELAEKIGISAQHVSNIETGKATFKLSTLVHIANELDVTTDDLLCDNLRAARVPFENEFINLVKDCSNYELRVICRTIEALKDSMRQNVDFQEDIVVEGID